MGLQHRRCSWEPGPGMLHSKSPPGASSERVRMSSHQTQDLPRSGPIMSTGTHGSHMFVISAFLVCRILVVLWSSGYSKTCLGIQGPQKWAPWADPKEGTWLRSFIPRVVVKTLQEPGPRCFGACIAPHKNESFSEKGAFDQGLH